MDKKLILISNDDSIYSKGIKELISVAKEFGQVVVVAPNSPQSAKSHAITLEIPLTYKKVNYFGEDVIAYECSGTPADSVKLALNHLLDRKPDLILSGINHGSNFSVNLIYSGTVAAAVEGAMHNIKSLALSVTSHDSNADFEVAKHFSRIIISKILNYEEQSLCLNINFPDVPFTQIKGVKFCKQTRGAWFEEFAKVVHPNRTDNYFWLTGKYVNFEPERTDTDVWAIENNYVSIVPLKIDFTDYDLLNKFQKDNMNL